MKKSVVLMAVLLIVLVVCLTGCNTNFKFENLGFVTEEVEELTVCYGKDRKPTSNEEKIGRVIEELNSLDIEKCKEKVEENVFNDSVVGKIIFKFKDKEGTFVMTFVETTVNGAKTSLLKCETTDGLKIKKMPKDIYYMSSVEATNAMLNKIFANYMWFEKNCLK